MFASLVGELSPVQSPWHPISTAQRVRSVQLAPGVWVLRNLKWVHVGGLLDSHADLPAPVVDVEDARRRSWIVPDWHAEALCAGMSFAAFFGAANDERPTMKRSEISYARRICAACPVKRACLDWSLSNAEGFGVWGGTSGRQRSRMRAEMLAGTSQAAIVEEWLGRWLTS